MSIQALIGKEISAVCFVRDYVELHFDGPVLRALCNPVVTIDGQAKTFPEHGSRDLLCYLIGKQVVAVTVVDDRYIEVVTDHGDLRINFDYSTRSEAAHFVMGIDLPIDVW